MFFEQALFVIAILCFGVEALRDVDIGRINLVAAGLCLFTIAIALA